MPVERCSKEGRPGFKACPTCTCFTYRSDTENIQSRRRARRRAERQLSAIKASQAQRSK